MLLYLDTRRAPNPRKVRIYVAEKGLTLPTKELDLYAGVQRTPEFLAKNPFAGVPILELDDGTVIAESLAIIEYLDEAYPEPRLMPRDPAARGRCRLLELEADEILLPPVRKLMHRTEPPGPDFARRERQEAEAAEADKLILGNYRALTARLGPQEFFCGTFSLADIAIFIVLHYGIRLGGPSLASHQNLEAWYQRLLRRPAFARAEQEIAAADRELSYPIAPRQPGSGK